MKSFCVLLFLVSMLFAVTGCHSVVQKVRNAHIYPFSSSPCPHYNYCTGCWKPSRGFVDTTPRYPAQDAANQSVSVSPDDPNPQVLGPEQPPVAPVAPRPAN